MKQCHQNAKCTLSSSGKQHVQLCRLEHQRIHRNSCKCSGNHKRLHTTPTTNATLCSVKAQQKALHFAP